MSYKTILLPLDNTEHSGHATVEAVKLAKTFGAKVIALHCHPAVPVSLGEPNFQNLLDEYTSQSRLTMEHYQPMLDAEGIEYEERIVGGETAEIIVETAKAEKCDLIVMGTKGKTDLEGLVLGSATHAVLQIAPCPVLVVR